MKVNVLFGIAAILAAGSLVIDSIGGAFAFNGPITGYGSNPAVSIGGTAYDGETKTLYTAPSDQDILITDVILTSTSNAACFRSHKTDLMLGSGAVLGQFETSNSSFHYNYGTGNAGLSIEHAFSTGLRIPAGDSLQLIVVQSSSSGYGSTCSNPSMYGVRYMVTGQYVQP